MSDSSFVLTTEYENLALRNFGAVVLAMNALGYKPVKGGQMVRIAVRQLERNLDKYGVRHEINDPEHLGHAAEQFTRHNARLHGFHQDLGVVMEAFVKDE